jgi:hypothetical protein
MRQIKKIRLSYVQDVPLTHEQVLKLRIGDRVKCLAQNPLYLHSHQYRMSVVPGSVFTIMGCDVVQDTSLNYKQYPCPYIRPVASLIFYLLASDCGYFSWVK